MKLRFPAELPECAVRADVWFAANAQLQLVLRVNPPVRLEDCIGDVVDPAGAIHWRRNTQCEIRKIAEIRRVHRARISIGTTVDREFRKDLAYSGQADPRSNS